jgi:hypothetical protein
MPTSTNLFWKILSAGLFLAVSGMVLFFAYGYRYDFEEKVIQKTSIIDVKNKINNVSFYYNDTLLSEVIPYQVKNVLPGEHHIKIRKTGFKGWERTVPVVEDIVTIIEDVLLVPENLDKYIKEKYLFDQDKEIYYGNNYVLLLKQGEKNMQILTLDRKGNVKDEDIQLFKAISEVVEVMDNERFILKFEDGLYTYVDFPRSHFRIFTLPEDAYNYKVNPQDNSILYMKDGDLFKTAFDKLSVNEYAKDIVAYDSDAYGNVIVIRNGSVFRIVNDTAEEILINENVRFKNLKIKTEADAMFLILRDEEDKRYLYHLKNGLVVMLSDDLHGNVYYDSSGFLFFMDKTGNVYRFDVYVSEAALLFNLSAKSQLLGLYADGKYLLFINENNSLELSDLYNKNRHILKENVNDMPIIQIGLSIFFTEEDRLKVLYFEDIMRR